MRRRRRAKKKAGERRRQAINFREAVLPFCGRSGGSTAKQWFEESARDNWDPREGNSHFDPTQTGSRTVPPR